MKKMKAGLQAAGLNPYLMMQPVILIMMRMRIRGMIKIFEDCLPVPGRRQTRDYRSPWISFCPWTPGIHQVKTTNKDSNWVLGQTFLYVVFFINSTWVSGWLESAPPKKYIPNSEIQPLFAVKRDNIQHFVGSYRVQFRGALKSNHWKNLVFCPNWGGGVCQSQILIQFFQGCFCCNMAGVPQSQPTKSPKMWLFHEKIICLE